MSSSSGTGSSSSFDVWDLLECAHCASGLNTMGFRCPCCEELYNDVFNREGDRICDARINTCGECDQRVCHKCTAVCGGDRCAVSVCTSCAPDVLTLWNTSITHGSEPEDFEAYCARHSARAAAIISTHARCPICRCFSCCTQPSIDPAAGFCCRHIRWRPTLSVDRVFRFLAPATRARIFAFMVIARATRGDAAAYPVGPHLLPTELLFYILQHTVTDDWHARADAERTRKWGLYKQG